MHRHSPKLGFHEHVLEPGSSHNDNHKRWPRWHYYYYHCRTCTYGHYVTELQTRTLQMSSGRGHSGRSESNSRGP